MGLALTLAVGCMAEGGGSGPPTERAHEALSLGVYAIDISVWSGPITDAEMDCFWDQGVRHVIVGTQSWRIARQQIEMALARGMSVDAYTYLYWDRNMTRQVEDALALMDAYPIGRLWLDAEEDTAGASRAVISDRLREAVDACGDFPCGIYTGAWWWNPNVTNDFTDVPLWYSHYDDDADMGTWATQSFGGWESPWGKQWMGDIYICGIDVDQNTIRLDALPITEHPAAVAASPGLPARPEGLYPDGETVRSWEDPRLLWAAVPGAASYEVAIEQWSGWSWRAYYTYFPTENARWFSPIFDGRTYRFRVRARNDVGVGEWSDYARFDFGDVTAPAPPDEPEPEPEPVPEPEPPPSGAPAGLTPDGTHVSTASVTLRWDAIVSATSYEVEIEYVAAGAYRWYYTYATSAAERRFWPSIGGTTYRFRVRATVGGELSPWSGWASFTFG